MRIAAEQKDLMKKVLTPEEIKNYLAGIKKYLQEFSPEMILSITYFSSEQRWWMVKQNCPDAILQQVWQYDPLHMIAMTAKRYKSTDNPNFITAKYPHFFQIQASSAESTLEIKVTDRFGNEYTESMKRPKAFSTDTYK